MLSSSQHKEPDKKANVMIMWEGLRGEVLEGQKVKDHDEDYPEIEEEWIFYLIEDSPI